jgi:hypothetical protein
MTHPVETHWRECGLPEWFLGNSGTNTKLYALYDAIRSAQPEYFSGCQLRGPGECQSRGMCQSMSCKNSGKVIVTRKCVEPKVDGIVYSKVDR